MRVKIDVDLSSVKRWAESVARDQIPFATAAALTRTARDAADEVNKALPSELDNPTEFTRKAFGWEKASKQTLIATVLAKPAQAKYLGWQVHGGSRPPNRKAQKLPTDIKLNTHGNIPWGEIARLVALANAGKRVSRKRGEKLGLSSKVDLFYGDPGDGKRPPGLYKRIVISESEHRLVPLVVFPRQNVRYSPKLRLREMVQKSVNRNFVRHFEDAVRQALATAR